MIDSLIIGTGEVGKSLTNVLLKKKVSKLTVVANKDNTQDDFEEVLSEGCKTLHICFPFSVMFITDVVKYIKITKPKLVIIHATVNVGTTSKINNKVSSLVVHSPVRGVHPHLEKGLLTFVKYIGTESDWAYKKATQEMSNITCERMRKPENTELGKLLSTSYYGVCISWHREMAKICKKFDVKFADAATRFNETYNEGYKDFKPNVVRPTLTPPTGKIGGHCVAQNAKLLRKQLKSIFLDLIK